MRICYVGPVPPIPGGIAQHGANLVGALRRAGATVRVLSWTAQYPRRLYPGSTRDPDGEALPGTEWRLRWWDPAGWVGAGRTAAGADAVVTPWVTPVQALPVGVLLRSAGSARRVVVAHNPLPHERRRADLALTRWALAPAQLALVHAQRLLPALEQVCPGVSTLVVPHPPNQPVTRRPLPAGPPPLKLLFLGYVRPYKGLDVAVEALARLRDAGHDVRLTVAGEFWEPVVAWEARLARLGVTGAVELRPGYVPDDALDGLLADHHLVVAPYRSATQSGIVPLAAAAGRAVVVSDVGGLREAVTDGVDGVLVAPDDAGAFADGVRRAVGLLHDVPSEGRPTWDDVAERLLTRL